MYFFYSYACTGKLGSFPGLGKLKKKKKTSRQTPLYSFFLWYRFPMMLPYGPPKTVPCHKWLWKTRHFVINNSLFTPSSTFFIPIVQVCFPSGSLYIHTYHHSQTPFTIYIKFDKPSLHPICATSLSFHHSTANITKERGDTISWVSNAHALPVRCQ
jgi:hypothetical protein